MNKIESFSSLFYFKNRYKKVYMAHREKALYEIVFRKYETFEVNDSFPF